MRLARIVALAVALLFAAAGCGSSEAQEGWRALAPSQLQRTEVAAARIGRFVYVMGGFEVSSGHATAATERYDTARDRWQRVADMPAALHHPGAVAYRGSVYVLGGYHAERDLTGEAATLYRYDPRRDRWSQLPSAPTARAALAVGVIGDRLYAAGGAHHGGRALTTLEIYDFRRRRWSRGPGMRKAREHLAGAVAGGRFYALAGRAGGQGNFAVVEAFDPRRRRWQPVPSMRKPRGGIAAATVEGRIVVFGGEEPAGTIREVELYDPARRRWTGLPNMRTPRHGLGGVAIGRRVLAIEGGDQPGFHFTNALEALTLRRR
jgi:N-acetylneuraminic acid mutarotase